MRSQSFFTLFILLFLPLFHYGQKQKNHFFSLRGGLNLSALSPKYRVNYSPIPEAILINENRKYDGIGYNFGFSCFIKMRTKYWYIRPELLLSNIKVRTSATGQDPKSKTIYLDIAEGSYDQLEFPILTGLKFNLNKKQSKKFFIEAGFVYVVKLQNKVFGKFTEIDTLGNIYKAILEETNNEGRNFYGLKFGLGFEFSNFSLLLHHQKNLYYERRRFFNIINTLQFTLGYKFYHF